MLLGCEKLCQSGSRVALQQILQQILQLKVGGPLRTVLPLTVTVYVPVIDDGLSTSRWDTFMYTSPSLVICCCSRQRVMLIE